MDRVNPAFVITIKMFLNKSFCLFSFFMSQGTIRGRVGGDSAGKTLVPFPDGRGP